MEVYSLQQQQKKNAAQTLGLTQNDEVKVITVASRRHNPSSISDSKGGVY